MSWIRDLGDNLRKIVLMEDKIDRLLNDVSEVNKLVLDHEKRLIRIETMIDMAQSRNAPTAIDGD